MKFAFLIMGEFCSARDRASIAAGGAQIVGVSTLEEACAVAKQLCEEGVGCIELCGAFGEVGARAVVQATGNSVPVGFVTHLEDQNDLYERVFPA